MALGLASDNLAREVRRLSALEALERDCGVGPVPGNLAADLAVARDTVQELSRVVDSLDKTDMLPPASVASDDAAPDPKVHALCPRDLYYSQAQGRHRLGRAPLAQPLRGPHRAMQELVCGDLPEDLLQRLLLLSAGPCCPA